MQRLQTRGDLSRSRLQFISLQGCFCEVLGLLAFRVQGSFKSFRGFRGVGVWVLGSRA